MMAGPFDIAGLKASPDWMQGKRIPSYVKHPGNKNKPHYNTLGRYAAQQAGTTGIQDPASGPGGFVQGILPEGTSQMNEWDVGLHNLTQQVKEGGFTVPFDEGPMDKKRWMEDIRGTTKREIERGNLPNEGSLNNTLHRLRQDLDWKDMTQEEKVAFARIYYKNKKTGMQGGIRATTGYNNNTAGSLRPFNVGQVDDLSHYAPLFAETELRQGDATEALQEWDVDKDKLLTSDPPYEGQPSTYSGNFALQGYLRQLQERLEEGQPVLAFDSAEVAPNYADIGLDPQIMIRPDNSSAQAKGRGPKPEMVAFGNIDGLDPLEVLSRYGHKKFVPDSKEQTELLDFELSEPQNAFEQGWAVLKQGGQ
tara:strand:- start:7689 stop:8780 length:1092 start_codon:yes stop_codon:yes gene_type:complete